eukprot:SAG25_NODE_380_length_8808_cov_3.861523_4_plen_173_part_00
MPLGSAPIVALVPASVRTSHCHNKSEGVGAEVECDLDQGGGQGNDGGHSCSGSSSSSDVSNDTWETAELAGEEQSGLAAATNEGEGEELLPEGLGPPSPARQPKPVLTVEPPSLSMRLEFGQVRAHQCTPESHALCCGLCTLASRCMPGGTDARRVRLHVHLDRSRCKRRYC